MSPIIPDPPLSVYARYFRPGVVFVTCAAVEGEPILGEAATAHLLRSVLRGVKAELSFTMLGWVILPEHVHLLLHPAGATPAEEIVRWMRFRFQREYPQVMGIPGEMVVWDRRQRVESVQDVDDFAARLDYIHTDPVRHGVAERPEAWEQSSYPAWVERGLYKLGWGWTEPERVTGKRWEIW